ncbi:MAG: glycosyltransferase family 4 protein [Rikenellaceae bacterium]|nr:glycosyltransferase family 4 protein [Rikenellaceae bacterium]
MHIVVISHSYPTTKTIDFVFVDQLCRAFADEGHDITIIAPQSITKCVVRRIPIVRFKSTIITEGGNTISLYRPFWVSLGMRMGKLRLFRNSFNKAVNRVLCKITKPIDVIYGHFWAQAIAAMDFAHKRNIPVFAVAGEGELKTHCKMTPEAIKNVRQRIQGCICVATKSKRESIEAGFVTEDKCRVFPNAINPNLFYPRNREKMRDKYGFAKDDFIIAFVGQWNSRKGVNRLCAALRQINNSRMKAMFMGKGGEKPIYQHTIFSGTVNHDILPEMLSCADVFVLPTINEGCSNAIVEAMACGLPIISSNMEFNWDVLNESNSVMINPLDIDQIANAIELLYNDKNLRLTLSNGALQTASELTISNRAKNILDYIKLNIQNKKQ